MIEAVGPTTWYGSTTAVDGASFTAAGRRHTAGSSLGMRQRLSVATAPLTEPPVPILDEPANGLDQEGIAWMRGLPRGHADAGGTVLISSHLLAELSQLVDDVVVISRGRVVGAGAGALLGSVLLARRDVSD
ncbi:ABC-type multidrug transport system ATPase subunit [Catenuloplanes atrovinosus]|uniref:ABC-type multidrug transport system ATPase subunit n=1 Tax=Catenuloplanes atrovinosus TaxID=137266 RepID=A0AAE4CAI8_9ACTN|nr:ABC-type multidrug transport system ATPase subunit [Catenuloplanes atrovinosus]